MLFLRYFGKGKYLLYFSEIQYLHYITIFSHDNLKNCIIGIINFCLPVHFSDVNYLSSSAPPAAAEWQSLLRPLRGREPEGMWNLLSIVREMFRRSDNNAVPLLEILTDEVLQCEQVSSYLSNAKKLHFSHIFYPNSQLVLLTRT